MRQARASSRRLPAIDIDGKVAEYVQKEDLDSLAKVISLGHVNRMRDGYRGGNLLHHCIWCRKGTASRFLIEKVPSLQYGIDNRGQTPLMYVINNLQQDTELLRIMSNVEPQLLNKQDTDLGNTALLLAVLKDCTSDAGLQTIQILMDAGASLDARDKRGYSAFYYAFKSNSSKLMDMLLKSGAKVEPIDIISQSIEPRNWPAMTEVLKYHPSLIDGEYKDCTLLMKLIRVGMQPQVKFLLESGAKPDLGEGALVEAARCGNEAIFQMLLQSGSNPSKFASALVSAAVISNNSAILYLVFSLEGVRNATSFNYQPDNHPQTIALYNKCSVQLLRHVAEHPHLRDDSLGVSFLLHPLSLYDTFGLYLELPIDTVINLAPLAIPLTDVRSSFYLEPTSTLLEVMMAAGYSAASPDNSFMSPLTLLLCNRRESIPRTAMPFFDTLFNYILRNGADAGQRITEGMEAPLNIINYLDIPDSLQIAMTNEHAEAVLRLLPFWRHPPPALCLVAFDFPHSDRIALTCMKMLPFLLPYGVPHGTKCFVLLEEFVSSRSEEEPSVAIAFKKYAANPLPLQQLCILEVRRHCNYKDLKNLPAALNTLPLSRRLKSCLKFDLNENFIKEQALKICTALDGN